LYSDNSNEAVNTKSNIMKTFELTVAKTGNILIINHHAKPIKEVYVYNSNGNLLNSNLTEQAFDCVRFYEKSTQVKGENMQEAVNNFIKARKEFQETKNEILNKEKFGKYSVDLKITTLENSTFIKNVSVKASNSIEAKILALNKYWKKPHFNATFATAL